MQAAHYRVTVEDDGSKRLCTFGFSSGGLDYPVKILELDEAGAQMHDTSNVEEFIEVVFTPDKEVKGETPKSPIKWCLQRTRCLMQLSRVCPFCIADRFFHDFLVSENYYIFVENPMKMDFWKFISEFGFGKASLVDCLYHDTAKPQKIHLIPRPGKAKEGEAVKVFEASSKFTFHEINAWETDTGYVVLDVLGKDRQSFAQDLDNLPVSIFENAERLTSVRRLVLQPRSGTCKEYDLRDSDLLRWRDFELPCTPPPHYTGKPHTAVFGMANRHSAGASGIQQSVLKIKLPHELGVTQPWDPSASGITVEEYYPGDGRYCGEPYFVAKPGAAVGGAFTGDDGYILVHVQDLREEGGERTWLEVLDAGDIGAGPLAAIDLQELVPPGLHGYWDEGVCLGPTENETDLPWENDIRVSL